MDFNGFLSKWENILSRIQQVGSVSGSVLASIFIRKLDGRLES